MKNQNFLQKGFTLIELLVVVAIIGLLASVVLSSLNSSRIKSADTSVKENLHTVANEAEIFYLGNSNSYLPAGGSVFAIATCPAYNASGTNMLSKNFNIVAAIAEAVSRGGNGSSCYNSGSVYAVAVGLKSSSSSSWCVDSIGSAKVVAFAPASAIDPVFFSCK